MNKINCVCCGIRGDKFVKRSYINSISNEELLNKVNVWLIENEKKIKAVLKIMYVKNVEKKFFKVLVQMITLNLIMILVFKIMIFIQV